MNRYYYQTNYIIKHDLITKFYKKNIFQLPKLDKIVLNIGSKKINQKQILNIILLLELITNQQGLITKSKKNKLTLKIKKGSIVGCKISLRKDNMFLFLEKLICFYFPRNRNFKGFKISNLSTTISFKLKNIFELFELTNEFLKYRDISNIDISICLKKNIKINNLFQILLSSYNFPILISDK